MNEKLVIRVLILTGLFLIAVALSACQSTRGKPARDPSQHQQWDYMIRFRGHK